MNPIKAVVLRSKTSKYDIYGNEKHLLDGYDTVYVFSEFTPQSTISEWLAANPEVNEQSCYIVQGKRTEPMAIPIRRLDVWSESYRRSGSYLIGDENYHNWLETAGTLAPIAACDVIHKYEDVAQAAI
jgi:hypothetical protein